MATVLERLRGAGVAAGAAVARYHIVDALVTAAGGAVGVKLSDYLKTNKTIVRLYQSAKEWGDFIIGFAIPIVYELAKERFRGVPYLDQFIYGMSAVLMSKTISVMMGEPFALVLSNGDLYYKNLSPVNGELGVMVDGVKGTYNVDNKSWSINVSEGVHDIVVIGAKKATYFREYTPSITSATQTSATSAK